MIESIIENLEHHVREIFKKVDKTFKTHNQRYIDKSLRDIRYSLLFTLEGLRHNNAELILTYYQWLSNTLKHCGIDPQVAVNLFDTIKNHLRPNLFPAHMALLEGIKPARMLESADTSAYIKQTETSVYLKYLLNKDRLGAKQHIASLRAQGVTLQTIYLDIIQPSLYEIGRLWQVGTIHVADEHLATVITQSIMATFYDEIFTTAKNGKKLLACAIGTELHEIGIRMVSDFFELDGFQTYYLGANMPPEEIARLSLVYQPDLICLSATLPLHLSALDETIHHIRQAHPNASPKIMIGGQAFAGSPALYHQFSADGFATDAATALKVGHDLVCD